MKNKRLFVTGTDTGVGKTVVAAGLVRLARLRGLRAFAIKPVETGCRVQFGELYPEDGIFLRQASENDLTLDECVPFRFSFPASPARAAAMAGTRLCLADLVEHVETLAQTTDRTIVEGAGGLLVPIQDNLMMMDFIERLGYPVLLVGRMKLGTINHSLLSVQALKQRGLKISGIVLSASEGQEGVEEEFTPHDLARLVKDIPVTVLQHLNPEVKTDPYRIASAINQMFHPEILYSWLGI